MNPSGRKVSYRINLKDFDEHCEHMASDLQYAIEFKRLEALSPRCSSLASRRGKNQFKNRYVNILAFDHSRVTLCQLPGDATSDYINANFIPGFNHHQEYIACQGPTPETIGDFWRMVWDHNCAVIVMVTQLMEHGQVKCELYWPQEDQCQRFLNIDIEAVSTEIFLTYVARRFKLTRQNEVREVIQFHYTEWGDFSCPDTPSDLVDFIQVVRDALPADSGPIIVHCSAGVGRTGTFIAVDRLMQHVQVRDYVDIFGLIGELRHYRNGMVQTVEQYIYIHECVRYILSTFSEERLVQDGDSDEDSEDEDEEEYANKVSRCHCCGLFSRT